VVLAEEATGKKFVFVESEGGILQASLPSMAAQCGQTPSFKRNFK
jgi:hypothetical protein